MIYKIAGWSADLGHEWNDAWLKGIFPNASPNSVFGLSSEGASFTGTTSPTDLFIPGLGFDIIQVGFTLTPVSVPEPSTVALAALGAATCMLYRLRRKASAPRGEL